MTFKAIYQQDTMPEYLAYDAVSSSVLRTVLGKSPGHAYYDLFHPKESHVFDFGSAVHAAVLQPELLDQYALRPESIPDRRTKAGKAAYAEFVAANDGKIILDSKGVYDALHGCVDGVLDNPLAAHLTAGTNGRTETSLYWQEKGVMCKARPDKISTHSNGYSCLVDLKTTVDCSERAITRTTLQYRYHVQAAQCLAGSDAVWGKADRAYCLIFVEKTAPYSCVVAELSDDWLLQGDTDRKQALQVWADCTDKHVYPLYDNLVLEAPPWM